MGFSTRQMRGRPSLPVVRSDEIPSPHAHIRGIRDSSKCTQRRGAHGGTEGLIEVNATHLCASLNAQPGFERPTAFTFIYPDEAHDGSVTRYVGTINQRPATVVCVIGDFCPLRGPPSDSILRHRLLASAGIGGRR
eukprot:4662755-Pleurochrysis_carterae.AAC.1